MENTSNRKWLLACIFVLGAVTIGTVAFLLIARLEQPLFLKNYCAYSWNNDSDGSTYFQKEFSIQYLSNTDDSRTVTAIEFPDITDNHIAFYVAERNNSIMDFMFSQQDNSQLSATQETEIYALHTVQITVQYLFGADKWDNTDIVLQNALIRFNNGSTQKVNIGEIRLYQRTYDNGKWLSQISSMGSSDGSSEQTLMSNDTLKILGLQCFPAVESKELFKITINGIDATGEKIKGMILPRSEIVTLRIEGDSKKFTTFNLRIIITVQDSGGTSREIELYPIQRSAASYDVWDVLQYKFKGGDSL